jgi:hypothetical protein
LTRRALAAPTPALIVVLALLAAPVHADSGDLDSLMALLAARRHGRASFIEQQFLTVLRRPVESRGELIYDAPGHLEKRTVDPRAERLTIDGDSVTIERGGHRHVLDLNDHPQLQPFVTGLRATLAGDRAQLERAFKLDFGGELERWNLRLTPLQAPVAKIVRQIEITGARDDLLRVEVLLADGDRSLMTLRPFTPQ